MQLFTTPQKAIPVDKGAAGKDLDQRFHRLLSANGSALVRLAGSYTDNASDRDDLFQDIALAIWQALPRFRGESSERTFIFRVAHNRAITRLARRRLPTSPEGEAEVPDPSPTPEGRLSQIQSEGRLLAAIHRLPIPYRQVVTLVLEDMSYAEIGDILGIAESNVGARLTRARQILRRLLEGEK
jgi:RNA polymerase sigma-70 factor (ECF subfamily)